MNFGKWKQRLFEDFKQKDFQRIKILFFLTWGAHVSLVPFLTLQARSLGISEKEVGVIYSFIPIASLIAPPVSGILADRIGNFRILLSVVTASAGLASLLFLLVPPAVIVHNLPKALPIEVSCSDSHGTSLRISPPYVCEPIVNLDWFSFQTGDCTVSCYHNKDIDEIQAITNLDLNLICKNSTNCFEGDEIIRSYAYSLLEVGNNASIDYPIYSMNATLKRLNATLSNETYESDRFLCPNLIKSFNNSNNCVTRCKATAFREDVCRNNVSKEILNPSLTFYSHLAIRLFNEFCLSSSMPLLDGAAVSILKEHRGDFGFQRMFANLGMMIMTPISGMLIDYFSNQNGFQDFRPAMYMYCTLKLIAAMIIVFLNLDFKKSSNKVISEFSSILFNPEVICFLLATFLAGTCYGYIETFLFWLLEDLGADKRLMGLTLTVGCLFGIPVLMISTFINRKIGHVNTIVIGFCVYVVRLLGYTFIKSPWWAMPFEAMECATVSLMVVSFMSYASALSTPATIVTLQGMYGGLYNGVGRGAGSLMGGFLIDRLGIFNAFRIIAALGGCSGIVYFIINLLFFRKNRQLRDEAVRQEKELRKAKDATATKQPINLSEVIDSKKEILNDLFIIVPMVDKGYSKDMSSKTNFAFEGENVV
ncbi:Major facilitator superfamily domain-containing protein 6 [Armadillidium nasatum]|uniref:Major facilitator superfamily domain-containing protein 6 n=1 Tax=Armadillidium nasatum TaxID=96803 RepID=A0A5N5TES8_9CRUS|nr:Major facilitator superfamily domain-containing protein 6 [Armadillidium nasatum]